MIHIYLDTQCRGEWGQPIYHELSNDEIKKVRSDELDKLIFVRSEDEEKALDRAMEMGEEWA